jgi:heme/copper-type cytochrome/quinol oxidase subunit 2
MTESTTPAQHPPDPGFRTTTEQDTPAKFVAALIAALSAGYFVPGAVATWRNTDNQALVWWLSALTSWTIVGWVVALILAAQRTEKHRLSIEKNWPARHPVLLAGAILTSVLFVVTVVTNAPTGGTQPSTGTAMPVYDAAPAASEAVTDVPEPAVIPEPGDFLVDITVLSEQCFGSAGCNVTYRATPSYVGTGDPEGQYTVIYELAGPEDGPLTGNFTADFDTDTLEYNVEDFTGTPSSDTELVATVTEVLPAN